MQLVSIPRHSLCNQLSLTLWPHQIAFCAAAMFISDQKKNFQNKIIKFTSDKCCDYCGKALIENRKYYIFPCLHGFHMRCLLKQQFANSNNGKKCKSEKRKLLGIFRRKMQSILEEMEFTEKLGSGIEAKEYAEEIIKKGKLELNGVIKSVKLSIDDYQALEVYNKQLEYLFTDECLYCGILSIETLYALIDTFDDPKDDPYSLFEK